MGETNLWQATGTHTVSGQAYDADHYIASVMLPAYSCPSRGRVRIIHVIYSGADYGFRAQSDYAGNGGTTTGNAMPSGGGDGKDGPITHPGVPIEIEPIYRQVDAICVSGGTDQMQPICVSAPPSQDQQAQPICVLAPLLPGQYQPVITLGTSNPPNQPVTFAAIRHNSAGTVLLGEKCLNQDRLYDPWCRDTAGYASGWDPATIRWGYFPPRPDYNDASEALGDDSEYYAFGSAHRGSSNYAMCDGSVRPISYNVSPTVFFYICSRDIKLTTQPDLPLVGVGSY